MDINKDDFPDVMIDLETTGTDSADCAIIQIAAVRFNAKAGAVAPDFFDRCLMIPQTKFWQEGGRDFWIKRKELYNQIAGRMEDPETVMKDLIEWCGGQRVLWAKPSHFEFPFLEAYFRRYELQTPFHYRAVQDMNSFMRGLYWPDPAPDFERQLPFSGTPHDAKWDTLHQVKVLLYTIKHAAQRDTTELLLSSEVNEKRLMKSIEQLENGDVQIRELIDPNDNPATGTEIVPQT